MATNQQIRRRLMIAWDMTNFIDETANLINASGDHAFVAPEEGVAAGRGIVDSMTLTMHNNGNRYSPLNTSSPIYASIQNGKAYHAPVYFEISVNGGTNYYRVFTGVIKTPQISSVSSGEVSIATIECRSKDELLLQNKRSTTLADMISYNVGGYDESQLINAWLTAAGVTGGDMTLSPGTFTIPWAWLNDDSVLEDVWQLASSCGGRFYCDPDGEYRYENSTHWMTASRSISSQETLARPDYNSCSVVYDDSELFNIVNVEASPREPGASDTLWEPDEPVFVPANSTKKMIAQLRQPIHSLDSISYTAVTSGGLNITANVTVTSQLFAQKVELTITNANTTYAAYLFPMRVVGQPLIGGRTHTESRNSTDNGINASFFTARGDRTKPVTGNVYIQTRGQASMLAVFLLNRFESPRITYEIDSVLGKPTRKLGDRITINDSSIMPSSRDAIVTSIRWTYSASGYTQDLQAIDATQLYPNYPSPGYFVVGTDTLSGTKVVFY